jgi:Zn finger protein HypA/HybF involved in hydrogenase expression
MAEYIEREDLIEKISSISVQMLGLRAGKSLLREAMKIYREEFLKCIKEAPIADVVEVVRCKDCEHLRIINGKGLYAYCPKTECKFEPFEIDTRTHYCSYGERKEGAEE